MPSSRAGLPVALTTFVGRQQEITALRDLLAGTRCVTLTGAGGSGKTRLAVEIGFNLESELSDGGVFVDLAPVADPHHVAPSPKRSVS